jgi:hypothetical protein
MAAALGWAMAVYAGLALGREVYAQEVGAFVRRFLPARSGPDVRD